MKWSYPVLITVSGGYPKAKGRLLTCYSPVRRSSTTEVAFPLDLHVLSTPPAFVLSQDQTLHRKTSTPPKQAERQSIRATSPDRTKLTCSPESSSKKPRHQHPSHPKRAAKTLTSTGQNKLIRRLIKHTVEFSRIRRTRSSPAGLVRSRGNLQKLTGRSIPRQTRRDFVLRWSQLVSASSDLLARRRRRLRRQVKH